MTEDDYKYRKSYIFIPMIFFFILSFWMILDSFKTYKSVKNIAGIIVDKSLQESKNGVTYCFRVDNHSQYFGIFLGADDNARKEIKYYDSLLVIGQPINIYYDNNLITKSENLTRLIYRLDYNGKTIIETNQNGRRVVGLVSLGIAFMFLWMRYWLKRKYLRELENNI